MATDYQNRLYQNYSSLVMGNSDAFDPVAADRWGKAHDHFLRKWLPRQKDAALLDVACGAGRLLHFFKRRGYTHLAGVDLSPEQVALARQVTPQVVQGDVLEFLEANEASFDMITGMDLIEHLDKSTVLRFLDASFRSLRANGRLVLSTVNGDSPFALPILYGDFTHETCFTPQALVSLLKLTGFTAIEVREIGPIPWGYSFKSSLRYLAWRFIRAVIGLVNTVETGGPGSGIFTRVMFATAVKGDSAHEGRA